jgi:hypothetical protein
MSPELEEVKEKMIKDIQWNIDFYRNKLSENLLQLALLTQKEN